MYKTPKLESIEIAGVTVKIEIDQYKLEVENECDGLYKNKVIYLRDEYMDKKHYKRILLHEAIHALYDILGVQMDHHAEEILTNMISYLAIQLDT